MAVLAIDTGINSSKAGVFEGGKILGYACRHYSYDCPEDGFAEQNPNMVWGVVDALAREAVRMSGAGASVNAVALSVMGDAVIPVDASGEPLAPAILGIDSRSHREAEELRERFGSGPLYAATGMPSRPLNSITKVLWLERNRPDIADSVWKYVHHGEFLGLKIASVPALDFSMASRTMAFDPVRKDWIPAVLEHIGIGPGHLGNVTPPGVPVGIVRASVADSWGIDRKALLISGGHNQCMAAIGAGAIHAGPACYSMGTAEVIGTALPNARMSPAMLSVNLPCYCHAAPDAYFTITLNQSGGGLAVEWLHRSVFGIAPREENSLRDLFGQLKTAPAQLLFLPHLAGSGTPLCDYQSRGAFVGLSLKTTQAEMLQAVIDSQAFEARINLEIMEELDIPVTDLRAVDWGARMWKSLAVKATVLDRPIHTLNTPDAALLGAAILAQTAMGEFADLDAACAECVRIADTIEPVGRAREAYREAFERYRPLYSTLRNFYHHWKAERLESAFA
jgi:xylulokinase